MNAQKLQGFSRETSNLGERQISTDVELMSMRQDPVGCLHLVTPLLLVDLHDRQVRLLPNRTQAEHVAGVAHGGLV